LHFTFTENLAQVSIIECAGNQTNKEILHAGSELRVNEHFQLISTKLSEKNKDECGSGQRQSAQVQNRKRQRASVRSDFRL